MSENVCFVRFVLEGLQLAENYEGLGGNRQNSAVTGFAISAAVATHIGHAQHVCDFRVREWLNGTAVFGSAGGEPAQKFLSADLD